MIKSIICRKEIPAITIMPACNKQAGIIYKKPTTYILVGIRRTHAYFTITFLTVPSDIFPKKWLFGKVRVRHPHSYRNYSQGL